MTSSPKVTKTFWEDVELASAQALVGLVADTGVMEWGLLQHRFVERARGFSQTLDFLEGMRALKSEGRYIYPDRGLRPMREALKSGKNVFMEYLTRLSLVSNTGYGRELREVCHAFRFEGGQAQMRPEALRREQYAARNFLLEGSAIRLHHETGICTINSWFHSDFIRARFAHGTTPQELEDVMKGRSDIGFAAELAVLEFERDIVGDRDVNSVIHVAVMNTNAGFDVSSIRRQQGADQISARLIEVKAVSLKDWQFTFTRNEVRVATENEGAYFLYLVPVVNGKPCIDRVCVLENPVENLVSEDEWQVTQGDWRVSRGIHNG